MTDKPKLLEICVASVDDTMAAEAGGAHRVELNSAIELGGLTPSIGCVQQAVETATIPVICMARPRPGGFCYSNTEFSTLLRDVEALLDAGADGVAFGVLDQNGELDVQKCQQVLNLAGGKDTVFHRAFDVCRDWRKTLHQLGEMGVTRVMTSGQKASALAGTTTIKEIVYEAGDRIEVLVAGGVRESHLAELIRQTGCDQVHAGLRHEAIDPSHPAGHEIQFCGSLPTDSDCYGQTDENAVRSMIEMLHAFANDTPPKPS